MGTTTNGIDGSFGGKKTKKQFAATGQHYGNGS